ncbi:MAG TPA: hypothetical protein VJN50_07525 [Actinomycetota bacterium]|nr:hypothetical protein [Actinomycetota bacterium]
MEDFSALASRIAVGVGEVRGCLILSRDGLVLGSFPAGDESVAKPAWLRFAALGDPEKGFLQYGEETWVYVRRGPYACFAIAGSAVRPGLLIEQVEQALLTAEESRAKREALKIPDVPAAPSGKPRTSLHKEQKSAPVAPVAQPAAAEEQAGTPQPEGPAPAAPAAPTPVKPAPGDEEAEVDRVLLAQEFSRLLQEPTEQDE